MNPTVPTCTHVAGEKFACLLACIGEAGGLVIAPTLSGVEVGEGGTDEEFRFFTTIVVEKENFSNINTHGKQTPFIGRRWAGGTPSGVPLINCI